MKYDCILALGTGIGQDGSLPDSFISAVNKAVELYKAGQAARFIFSGRWSYQSPFTPPLTEAQAMKLYAIKQGIPPEDILIEDESVTTVSNLCLAKKKFLEKHSWKKILLIGIEPHAPRTLYNARRVLGTSYTCDLQLADFRYAPAHLEELKALEKGKLQDAIDFYKSLSVGDHEAIYNAAMADLKQNYMKAKP